jgi:hypothetical protein
MDYTVYTSSLTSDINGNGENTSDAIRARVVHPVRLLPLAQQALFEIFEGNDFRFLGRMEVVGFRFHAVPEIILGPKLVLLKPWSDKLLNSLQTGSIHVRKFCGDVYLHTSISVPFSHNNLMIAVIGTITMEIHANIQPIAIPHRG